jgi:4-hydroxy-2-oxoheptanedioate aldolase
MTVHRNAIRARLAEGKAAIGVLVTMPSANLAQIFAASGFDFLMIDREHGPIDEASMHAMIAATAGSGCAPIVRVPKAEGWLAKPALDSGAFGIVFPMVSSPEEAARAAGAVRYPPRGERGWGPFYAPARWGVSQAEYQKIVDDEIMSIILLEQAAAVPRLDAILATPGLDAAWIAPFDLSMSYGKAGAIDDPEVKAAVATIEKAVLGRGIVLGGLARGPDEANAMIARGYRMVLMGYDLAILQRGIAGTLEGLRRALP